MSFPDFCPTRREFSAGTYPVKRFDSISGAGVTRLYGSKASNATLQLSYLLADTEVAEFLESYHSTYGGAVGFALPLAVYSGIDPELRAQARDYYTWRWNAAPQIQSVMPGRSRIQVSLIGTLDG